MPKATEKQKKKQSWYPYYSNLSNLDLALYRSHFARRQLRHGGSGGAGDESGGHVLGGAAPGAADAPGLEAPRTVLFSVGS